MLLKGVDIELLTKLLKENLPASERDNIKQNISRTSGLSNIKKREDNGHIS